MGGWIKLHNEIHNFYSSPVILGKGQWAKQASSMHGRCDRCKPNMKIWISGTWWR